MEKPAETIEDIHSDLWNANFEDEVGEAETKEEVPEPVDEESSTVEGEAEPQSEEAPTDEPESEVPEGEAEPSKEEPVEEPKAEESAEEASEEEPAEEEEPAARLIELPTGEQVPEEELVNGFMRQSDYTRKTQALADQRRQLEQQQAGVVDVIRAMTNDESLKAFVVAHPEALPLLVQRPDEVRAMLGSPEKVEQFWKDYEAIENSPTLAKRFLESPEEARQEAAFEEHLKIAVASAQYFEEAVSEIAKEYEGADAAELGRYIGQLSNMPANPSQQEYVEAMGRVYSLLVMQDPVEGPVLREDFIRRQLKLQVDGKRLEQEAATRKAQSHNEEVDEALRQDEAPPATPQGNAPSAVAEEEEEFDDLEKVVEDLRGW
jgi:hypothetical protein